jgi:hypothetical protein
VQVVLNNGLDFMRLEPAMALLSLTPDMLEVPLPAFFLEDRVQACICACHYRLSDDMQAFNMTVYYCVPHYIPFSSQCSQFSGTPAKSRGGDFAAIKSSRSLVGRQSGTPSIHYQA